MIIRSKICKKSIFKAKKVVFASEQDYLFLLIIIPILPIIIGIILGLNGKITVFRNYNDLWLMLWTAVIPLVFFFMYVNIQSDWIIILGIIFELLLFIVITFRTYNDNRGIFSTLLALYTKIPLCILGLSILILFIDKTRKRQSSLFEVISFLLFVPLLNNLVKDKTGVID